MAKKTTKKPIRDNLPFGQRLGFEPIEKPFQIDSADETLRTELWNAIYIFILVKVEEAPLGYQSRFQEISRLIWVHFYKKALDVFSTDVYEFNRFIKWQIEKGVWYRIYELIEFILTHVDKDLDYDIETFRNYINSKLQSNYSAYRLIGDKFTPITNEIEISEIQLTQKLAKQFRLTGIQEHLETAINLLSKKPNPDYRNSIKESISMVEVISRIIEPKENTLGKALNRLERNGKINPTLKSAFDKLYAYTNDKNGIRHALMEDHNVDIGDARFFIIACSAFTNYLIEKASKEKLI